MFIYNRRKVQKSKRYLMFLQFAWRQWTGYCYSAVLLCSVRFCLVYVLFCSCCPVSVLLLLSQSLSSAGENIAVAIAMQKKILLLFSSLGFPRVSSAACLAVWLHPNSAPGSVKCKCLHRKLACIELISSSCVKWKELRGLSLPLS